MRTNIIAVIASLAVLVRPVMAAPALVQVSADPFTNAASQHKTEVEPDTFAGGGADIGWATSQDGGTSWKFGFLSGITKAQNPNNRYDAVSDPAVAYDAAHQVWMISSLPLSNTLPSSPAVLISRSADGAHWAKPVGIGPCRFDEITAEKRKF